MKNSDNIWEKSNWSTSLLLTLTIWRVITKNWNKRKKLNWLKLKSMLRLQLINNGKKKKDLKSFNLKNQKKTSNLRRSTKRKIKRKNNKSNKKNLLFLSVSKLNSKPLKFYHPPLQNKLTRKYNNWEKDKLCLRELPKKKVTNNKRS